MSIDSPTQQEPEAKDATGYRLTSKDLNFLDITPEEIRDCSERRAPLSMSPTQYHYFKKELITALWREQIISADVRIQGSSVNFFSNPRKTMPYEIEDIQNVYAEECKTIPSEYELVTIHKKVESQWPPEEDKPQQRPFDALYKFDISPHKSDYDIQISGRDPYEIMQELMEGRTLKYENLNTKHQEYKFMSKEYSDNNFLYLQNWAATWWTILKRPVSIAIFNSQGPDQLDNYEKSSHFKDSDWIVHQGLVKRRVLD